MIFGNEKDNNYSSWAHVLYAWIGPGKKKIIEVSTVDGFRRDAESVFDMRFLQEDMLKVVLGCAGEIQQVPGECD